jgi:glycine C-acetyltransferase
MANPPNRLEETLAAELASLRAKNLYKQLRTLESPQGARVRMNGRDILMLSSNNYLGLADHPRVLAAMKEGIDTHGSGTASVRFICGTTDLHRELERRIAAFLGREAALTYLSCWDANVGLIPCLLTDQDAVFSDALNHASIIDAIRLCKAKRNIYPHRDMAALERMLTENAEARLKMIVTDGVFSMEGDLAPLPEICDLAERYGAFVVVDDSHATGVLGERGRGTPEHFGLGNRVDVVTSTMGKTLSGACGGFIAGRQAVIDYLIQMSRPSLFSNALPPAVLCGAMAAMEILQEEPERLTKLRENARYYRAGIAALGFHVVEGLTPIVPVIVKETPLAIQMSRALFEEEGVFVSGFGYPVVPEGEARLRCQVSAAHETADLDRALAAFERIGRKFGVI